MQYFNEDMKQILLQVLEFQIVQGATFWDTQLAPSKFNPWGASGQLLISNTAHYIQVNSYGTVRKRQRMTTETWHTEDNIAHDSGRLIG